MLRWWLAAKEKHSNRLVASRIQMRRVVTAGTAEVKQRLQASLAASRAVPVAVVHSASPHIVATTCRGGQTYWKNSELQEKFLVCRPVAILSQRRYSSVLHHDANGARVRSPFSAPLPMSERCRGFTSESPDVSIANGAGVTVPASLMLSFEPPKSWTHESLAYAACPVCRQAFHMRDMLTHLISTHREIDQQHCSGICQERLDLYHEVIGVPLKRQSTSFSRSESILRLLPIVLSNGYLCNWCEKKGDIIGTRDLFLKHVLSAHPEVDIDDIEEHVPFLPTSSTSRPQQQQTLRHRERSVLDGDDQGNGGIRDCKEREAVLHCTDDLGLGKEEGVLGAATLPSTAAALMQNSSGDTSRRPTRRVRSIQAHEDDFRPAKSTAPRILGVSIPRDVESSIAAVSVAARFTKENLPCELCGKAFLSEVNLLQHLELRHPTGTLSNSGLTPEAAQTVAEVARAQIQEAVSGGAAKIAVVCDLCSSSSKTFSLPSALFSHIRFKHPSEDAAFHVNRMIEEQSNKTMFVCKVCSKAFASEEALKGHYSIKHVAATSEPGGRSATMNNRWWCHDCEKGFGSAKGLHGHLQGKHGLPTQSFLCPACKRVFGDVHSLQEHIMQVHKNLDTKDLGLVTEVMCPSCERLFLSYEELHRHAIRHHRKDPRAPVREYAKPPEPDSATPTAQGSAASHEVTGGISGDISEVAKVKAPRKVKAVRRRSSSSEGDEDASDSTRTVASAAE